MKKENIKSYTKKQLDKMIARGEGKTNYARLETMTDDEIDTSEIPELGDWFWKNAVLVKPKKSLLTLRVDSDLLTWLKRTGKGYQTRINALLRAYMIVEMQKRHSSHKTR